MDAQRDNRPDDGFSLVELLVVIVILGILAAAVVFAVRRIVSDGEVSACAAEKHTVGSAVETWFATHPGGTVTPTGAGEDRFELTLVNAGLIRSTSTYLNLADDGSLSPAANSPC